MVAALPPKIPSHTSATSNYSLNKDGIPRARPMYGPSVPPSKDNICGVTIVDNDLLHCAIPIPSLITSTDKSSTRPYQITSPSSVVHNLESCPIRVSKPMLPLKINTREPSPVQGNKALSTISYPWKSCPIRDDKNQSSVVHNLESCPIRVSEPMLSRRINTPGPSPVQGYKALSNISDPWESCPIPDEEKRDIYQCKKPLKVPYIDV